MKTKKGILPFMAIFWAIFSILVLGLLVWFGFKISTGIVALIGFFRDYWYWGLILTGVIIFRDQLRAVTNWVLTKFFGIKV